MSAREWRVFVLLALTWGSMYIAVKKALPAFTPLELVAWRYVFAGIVLAPVAWRLRAAAQSQGGIARVWPWLLLVGLLGSFGPVLFTTLAQRTEPSALAGMFAALTPILTALFAWALLGQSVGRAGMLGLGVGLAGALLLVGSRASGPTLYGISAGSLWFVAACFCWASTTMLIRLRLSAMPPLVLAAWSMLLLVPVSGATLIGGAHLDSVPAALTRLFSRSEALWFWLTVALQIGSIISYNWLILNSGPVRATAVTYALPFVSLGWGLLDGESLGLLQLAGLCLVLSGLYLLSRGSPARK